MSFSKKKIEVLCDVAQGHFTKHKPSKIKRCLKEFGAEEVTSDKRGSTFSFNKHSAMVFNSHSQIKHHGREFAAPKTHDALRVLAGSILETLVVK